VAYVGRSGFNTDANVFSEIVWGEHLHLQYYNVQYDVGLDVGERNENRYIRVIGTHNGENIVSLEPPPENSNIQMELTRANRRNPFDHSETQR
jgi:hypothetical protein